MRARHGLANILELKGRPDEAIHHFKEMLRLNPEERGILAGHLFREERDEELAELLNQYEGDADPDVLYTRALWLFRTYGDCDGAGKALSKAVEKNSYVPSYLLGKRKIPKAFPDFVKFGGPEQAGAFALDAVKDWRSTQGALYWLRRQTSKKRRR